MPQRYRMPSTLLDYMCEMLSRQKDSSFAKSVCRAKKGVSKIEGLWEQAPCMRKTPLDKDDLLLGIGLPDIPPRNSVTNKANAFSNVLSENSEDDRGSMRGAIRHVLWQADITAKYGGNAARHIGNCHEREMPFYPNETLFSSPDDADRTVDQWNNVIGRQLGDRLKHLSTKERAIQILQKALTEGVYRMIQRSDGYFEIVKEPMNKDEYERAYQQILRLNDNGKIKE